jgi:hypothetical protein
VIGKRDDDADQPPVLVVEDAREAANNSPADQVPTAAAAGKNNVPGDSPNLLGTAAASPR